jgi:NADH-quinone oxidoreductase subunit N
MSLFLTPEVLLLAWALLLLVLECFNSHWKPERFAELAMAGVALVLVSTWLTPGGVPESFAGLYVADGLAIFFKRFFLITAFLVLWMGRDYIREIATARAEFFILPLLTTVGLLLLASAADFTLLFVALELVTISFYVLVAFQRNKPASLEAGTKYLIIGGLSAGFLVYGIAFLYGTVGTTRFADIATRIPFVGTEPALLLALGLITIGLCFKVAAVPFHVWVPDVYQGAPTPVTAFLAIGSKAAGFVLLLRLFCFSAFGGEVLYTQLASVLGALALGSAVLGGLAAIPQRNLKRLLGYSSISHAGFLLMALGCLTDRGASAVVLYLSTYLLAGLLAFHLIAVTGPKLGGEDFRHFAGLSQRSPWVAFGLTVAFVSMAGLPPLVGFFAKLSIFGALWDSGRWVLLGAGLLSAAAGIYYYLGIVRAMYWQEPVDRSPLPVSGPTLALIVALAGAIVVFGIWQAPLIAAVESVWPEPTAMFSGR